ncbi:hypothetical protein [Rhizobium sp.]|uniref:hypothetical protein n=1 Tax=Rhizobium sp. TaxID=391 RepID=UPI0028A67EB1
MHGIAAEAAGWTNGASLDAIKLHGTGGMGHGTAVDPLSGYGTQNPYTLDLGIPSTKLIARNWA